MNNPPTQWQVWQKTYTETKQVLTQTSPTGNVTTHMYDALDREAAVIDAAGRKVRTEFFKDGKTLRVTRAYQSPLMPVIVYATYALTPNGQVNTVTDANGNVTNLDYDGFDRIARTFFPDPVTGLPCNPSLPHSSAAPSCTSGQKYEERGYDASGNITSKRNRSGAVIGFVFDDLNREITRNVPANALGHFARTLTTTYDLAGRKYDATAAAQTISHRYDAAARVDFVTDSYFAPSGTTDYGYDAAGNRTTLVYPGGTTVAYTYDALNRMDTVTEGGVQLADYDWDVLSRRDLVKLNNAAFSMDYGYEDDDDLATLAHTGPAPVTYTLGRNPVGQITSLAMTDGAFLSRPPTAVMDTYAASRLNQISTLNAAVFAYDTNGNLTSDGNFAYEYDEENRLRAATGTGMSATYEYDPLGRRRAKSVGGITTRYVASNADEIEERDASGIVLRSFVFGASVDDPIAMRDLSSCPGGSCFFQRDWQGSIRTVLQQDGALQQVYHYGPYGDASSWDPPDPLSGNPYRFTGRRLDFETGLYFYRARFYSPRIGGFLQVDPAGAAEELNLYLYGGSDPLNTIDPSGSEVTAMYSNESGTLFMKDDNSGQWAFVRAESGGKPFGDPAPPGGYAVLSREGREGFYRLERKDDRFGDDETPEGRTSIRLHHPGRTIGCIAACDAAGWGQLEGLLKATSTSTTNVESGSPTMRGLRDMAGVGQKTESVTQFGRLRVLPSGFSLTYDKKTGSVDVKYKVTGSNLVRTAHVCTADPKTSRCQ